MRDRFRKPLIGYLILVVAFGAGIWRVEDLRAEQAHDQARTSTAIVVAGCQAVQHANQLQDRLSALNDKFMEILNTGNRAGQPLVIEYDKAAAAYKAAVKSILSDTRLCDIAAQRAGHPIRPFPMKENP